ncbi:MAG: YDG domain-containing protein, partial [Pseudomonadota bacterium]
MHKHASTNRFYRLVWSHVHSCWVAVAEGARGRGKSASRKLTAALIGAALSGAALAAPPGLAGIGAPAPKALPAAPAAGALPTGAQVVAGQASVTQAANQMTVHQGSDKAILNWQSFDIGANAGVRFVQPNANAVALNRVLGNDPSRIYGQLSANGKVFLVNQSGVLFGASARVDVGGLIASSLALPDGDFLAGRYTFSGSSDAGAVRNEGSIRTSDGGYVALLGPSVANTGSIVAPNGSVALGAGEQVGVDLRGDGLITLRVDRGAVAALAENSGLVQADGGRVELSAKGADALARATVNNTGVVQARGLVADGGSIRLVGDGDVHAGALDASSRNGRGGAVAVEGRFVALDGTVDASGVRGGSVDVNAAATLSTAAATNALGRAGDGGAVSYRSAGMVIESSSASVDASGLAKGGSIGVQGDGGVLSSGSYSARSSTGIGGRIDVSGSDVRLLGAQLDASGNTQGGLVRVGGAFQGGAMRADAPDLARFVTRWGQTGNIANATSTFVGDGTAIKAGATGRAGQGGTAVVWSDKQTTMLGSVDARGAGAAGTVEISSKDELRHVGLDRIALGAGGQLLLDPKNITIGSSASAWTYQAVLGRGVADKGTEVGNLEGGDGFGMAVALNAAGTRLAVGAPYDDGFGAGPDTARERGAVHLFSFTDANFAGATLQGTIGSGYTGGKNLNVTLDDMAWFGSSVALNADATRLAVGASYDAGGLGSVRMFSFGGDQFAAPALTATLRPDDVALNLPNSSAFGTSVALNAVGDRLAVGAAYDQGANGACVNCGAVYLFNNALATPTFVKGIGAGYGVNMPLPTDAQFGTSVAFDGSGDRLAVGAFGVNNAGGEVSAGAVYLFNNAYGATSRVATLGSGFTGGKNLNLNLGREEGFGSSVAFNSAGTRLAVGATGGNGKVRIIDFVDNQFSGAAVTATLGSGNTEGSAAEVGLETSEWFGSSVALNGAGDRLVVGSPFGDGDASDPNEGYGAVRAFGLMPAPATSLAFGGAPSANATIDASMLESALDSGTSITLQANNDITFEAGNDIILGGSGNGSLTLQAGRSIFLNSTIVTGNADLTLVANETTANGVVNAYRDAGAAVITTAAGATINAGTGRVSMTIANGAGKTNSGSGAITIGGNLLADSVSLKNLGTSANSNVVIGAAGSIMGTGSGLIEVVASNANSTFLNYAGAAGIDPGAGRYLVYSNNPIATFEGLSGYKKHYNQTYTGSTPVYASNGNWFLYSIQPTLTVSAAAASRTYDGSTALPALGYGVSGLIDGDDIGVLTGSLGVTGLTRNAGTYAINAGSLGNNLGYAINFTGANFTITPRVLNATVAGVNKTYDGNNVAGVNFGDDRISGDVLSYGGVARFSDKNAGTGKTVNVTGITLGGTHAANYTLASNSATTSADIAKRTLTASAIGLNKTYDGGTSANVLLNDDRVAGDVLSLTAGGASFQNKNAGNGKTVNVTGIALGGDDAINYTLASTSATTSANIFARVLNANATGLNKTYDGGTAANVVLGDDRVAGDVLSLTAGGASFADKNAGSGKSITVTGIALGGDDAINYTLASTTVGTSADIAKRDLSASVSGVNKTYDGNNAATVGFSDDRVAGDVLEYSASASFADKNAGSGKAVTVTGIAVGGQDAGNYTLVSGATGATQADITKRTLVASAIGLNKTYDGGTAANVVLVDDRVAGDVLALNADGASFADKNAGTGKAITVSGIALDGQDAGNYELASTSAGATADIGKRTLVANATGVNKTYDGNTSATVTFGDDRVTGDVLAYNSTASFADKNAGSGKAITVTGIALGGQDAGNYELASTSASTSA